MTTANYVKFKKIAIKMFEDDFEYIKVRELHLDYKKFYNNQRYLVIRFCNVHCMSMIFIYQFIQKVCKYVPDDIMGLKFKRKSKKMLLGILNIAQDRILLGYLHGRPRCIKNGRLCGLCLDMEQLERNYVKKCCDMPEMPEKFVTEFISEIWNEVFE